MPGLKTNKTIRLGIVRCSDIHGYYYGAMLGDYDPELMLKHYYVVHYYSTNIYNTKRTMPRVSGFDIVKVWDYDLERANTFAKVFRNKPKVCQKLEDMAEDVDAIFISNGELDGSDHLKLATPFIKKKLPTFIDKPFASNLKDARALVSLAERHNTPIFNASIMGYVPAADFFKQRFKEIDHTYYPVPDEKPKVSIGLGVVKGVGGAFSQELAGKGGSDQTMEDQMAYLIHSIAFSLNIFGKGVDSIQVMGDRPLEHIKMHMKNGMDVVIMNTSTEVFPEFCNFFASAFSKYGAVHSNPIGDPEFIGGAERILRIFKKMIHTGKPPVPYQDFIEQIAIIEAGILAQKKGTKVFIDRVLNGQK